MRKLVFCGNCQAQALAAAYNNYVAPSTEDLVSYIPDYEAATDSRFDVIRNADIIVQLLMEPNNGAPDFILAADRPIIFVPFVAAAWLWPNHGTPHPFREQFQYGTAPMVDCADSFLNRMVLKGVEPETASNLYCGLKISEFPGIERRYHLHVEKQSERDNFTKFETTDFILNNFRSEKTFLTPFHPTLPLAKYVAVKTFEKIDVARYHLAIVEKFMEESFYPKFEVPIHPAVANYFGLKYISSNTTFRWFSVGRITFSEYAQRYMTWDVNLELEQGLEYARSGDSVRAREFILRGLVKSPEAPEGYIALLEIMLRDGKIEDALEIAKSADLNVKDDWYVKALYGVCLAKSEHHEEAIAAYRQSIQLNKGVANTYVDLSFSLAQLGQYSEARSTICIALEIQPNNKDARIRLESLEEHLRETPTTKPNINVKGKGLPSQLLDFQTDIEFLFGWHNLEPDLIWCGGNVSAFLIRKLKKDQQYIIEFGLAPCLIEGVNDFQRLRVLANGNLIGEVCLRRPETVAFIVPNSGVGIHRDTITIWFEHPDYLVPALSHQAAKDERELAIALTHVRIWLPNELFELTTKRRSVLRLGLDNRHDHVFAMSECERQFGITCRDLVLKFESIGTDCEFGLFQRDCSAEPLGLLRFSTVFLKPLLLGLEDGFSDLTKNGSIYTEIDNSGEYIINQSIYNLRYHTFFYLNDGSQETALARERKKLPFLLRKFKEDLQDGEKIFVFKTFEERPYPGMMALCCRLQKYNCQNKLLFVTKTVVPQEIGTVEEIAPNLFHGHLDHLTVPRVGEDGRFIATWLEVCVNTLALVRGGESRRSLEPNDI